MEKWKNLWRSVLRWNGWTAWLHWEIWKKIGSWSGWKRLLFPRPALVLLLSAVGFGGTLGVFLRGWSQSMLAVPVYVAAFYALVTLTAMLVTGWPGWKKKLDAVPAMEKLRRADEGAFGIGMYLEQFLNFFYGVSKLAGGIVSRSAWLGADGMYNFVQALIQLYQILRHKQVTDLKRQWKSYRQCGFMMIVVNLTMLGMMYQMIHLGRHEESSEISIIATAAFTFYKLSDACIQVAKDRRHKNPVDSAVYFLNFGQALYNLFVLQVGLLWVFGGSGYPQALLMNTLTATGVSLLVLGMGIYMIWRAGRDMKKLEEIENG